MTTPDVQSNSIEADALPGNSAGALSTGMPPSDMRELQSNSDRNNRSNLALFSIGAVAAIGLSIILIGVYLTEQMSLALIVAGIIVLDIAVIAWIIVALITIVDVIRRIVISHGAKPRRPQPR